MVDLTNLIDCAVKKQLLKNQQAGVPYKEDWTTFGDLVTEARQLLGLL